MIVLPLQSANRSAVLEPLDNNIANITAAIPDGDLGGSQAGFQVCVVNDA